MSPKRPSAVFLRTSSRTPFVSTKRKCETCEHEVWATAATAAAIDEHNCEVVCVNCFEKWPPQLIKIKVTDGQLVEMEMLNAEAQA